MKGRGLVLMLVLTAPVVGGALYAVRAQRERTAAAPAAGGLYPDLLARVNDVSRLEIAKGLETLAIARGDSGWTLPEKGGYAATFEKVKETIVAIAGMTIIEPKTSSRDLYSKIGVQDLASPVPLGEEGPTLVTMKDSAGGTIVSLIIGKPRAAGFSATQELYVRRAGEEASWLVRVPGQTRLQITPAASEWVKRDVIAIPRDRVKSVTTTFADGERVRVERETAEQQTFQVADIPEGREISYANVADPIASALAYVSLEDVRPAAEVDGPTEAMAEFRTFDNLLITVTTVLKDGKSWAKFHAAFSEENPPQTPAESSEQTAKNDQVRKEAETLNAGLEPWAFALGDYKAKSFATRMKDLLKEAPAEQPAPARDGPVGPESPLPDDPGVK